VSDTRSCLICGTVNLAAVLRCIACGTSFDAQEQRKQTAAASARGTLMMHPEEAQARLSKSHKLPEPVKGPAPSPPEPTGEVDGTPERRFLLRLLVAEVGPSNVEVGATPVTLGSGEHDVGERDDPCVAEAEAKLFVVAGDLFLEPTAGAHGVYVRIRDEAQLEDGDVILLGYVAAEFSSLPAPPPVDGTRRVIGGTAASPCARLTFLRRDGTPGPIHDVPAGKTILGRTGGHMNFPDDSRLSRQHACLVASDNGVRVEDMDSRNGTFLRVRKTIRLEPGDSLRIGQAGLIVRSALEP